MNTPMQRIAPRLALAMAAMWLVPGIGLAQIAGGSTTLGISVTETTELAKGWSVKRSLMGKAIYNESGQRVGKVEDLIIAPDRAVSYVIVGAGGFIGLGRHDVAIPVAQIKAEGSRLIMQGATKDALKALPHFDYAIDTSMRDRFVAKAEADIAAGKDKVAALQAKANSEAGDIKLKINAQAVALQADVKLAEDRVAEMKKAAGERWRSFESGVSSATARLRRSVANATA